MLVHIDGGEGRSRMPVMAKVFLDGLREGQVRAIWWNLREVK